MGESHLPSFAPLGAALPAQFLDWVTSLVEEQVPIAPPAIWPNAEPFAGIGR